MAALMRTHDWAQSPLGCPGAWPPALRSVVTLILGDMTIPGGISGLENAGDFRRRRPAVPIVLTTGLASWAVDARAADITLLLKPYGSDELGATLGAELKRAHA